MKQVNISYSIIIVTLLILQMYITPYKAITAPSSDNRILAIDTLYSLHIRLCVVHVMHVCKCICVCHAHAYVGVFVSTDVCRKQMPT